MSNMNYTQRIKQERQYWDKAALDPEVDKKYICDLPKEAFDKIIDNWNGDVLEIGCGVGRLMRSGWCGVDISVAMLAIARERRPDCHFYLTDGRTLPFDDGVFHAVYSVLVFQHLDADGIKAYIKEAYRVLEDNGLFKFQFIEGDEHAPFSQHYLLNTVLGWLEKAGFTVKEVNKGLIHYQWSWVTCQK